MEMTITELKAWTKLTPGGRAERAVAKLIHNHRMLRNQVRWFTKRIVSDATLLAAKAPEDEDDNRGTEEVGGSP